MSRKRPLVLSESENESQYYPGKPNNTTSLVKSTYRDAWARFYEWDEEDSRNTLKSLRATSARRNRLPMHDELRPESGLQSSGSPLTEEAFSIVEYDEQNGTETVTVGRIQGKDPTDGVYRNLSYDSCTPISRNIQVGDDSDTLAFLPFADDPTFDWKDFVDQHAYCAWQEPSRMFSPCESFVTVQVARELVERHGISVEEIDRTAVSPVRLLETDCERGILARDDLGDWFRHFFAQPGADGDVFLPRSLVKSAHLTEASQINLGTDVFCNNLNCIISCCTTHLDNIPPPPSVVPTLMSTELSYDILEPCDRQCFLYVHTNTIPSNWTAEELEALTLTLRISPDTSPCDLAIICKKPCYEVFRWRKRLINDNTIEKAKLEHRNKVVRRSEARLKDTRPIVNTLANAIVHDVEVREGVWGLGCFILEPVAEDEFILEYVGELVYEETVLTRDAISIHRHRNYVFTLNESVSVDAERAGNESRYINHDGARPNCRARIKRVNGEHRIGLYANWDLEPGTELLLDYGPDYFKDKEPGVAARGVRKNPVTR
ncbi:Histone-lysine N-methyltransferase setd7 [Marasmius tenuissimus]|uniref:Histone-lysine N-methyltransferase setd7 n=1 Tax=Marasmius tenuissimus TaxID=585030 RepID=A0ABR2ZNH1_9AGAR